MKAKKCGLWPAGPAIFTRFSNYGVNVISQAFVGHIGATELAAFALILTVLTKFDNGLLLGAAGGLETLCGQAYGARQYHMLGIYLQRSWVVLVLASTLLLPISVFAAPIFIVSKIRSSQNGRILLCERGKLDCNLFRG